MKKLLLIVILMLGVGVMFSSCSGKKSAIDGYEWLEGKWITDIPSFYNCVIVTKNYFQYASELEDGEVITDVTSKPKNDIVIEMYFNQYIQSDVKTVGIYHIDEAKKQIYWLYDFDQKMYMKKME